MIRDREAMVRAAILLRDGVREARRKARLNGQSEPAWCAVLDAEADNLTATALYEDDAITRRKYLRAAGSRRYRRRVAADRARQREHGAA